MIGWRTKVLKERPGETATLPRNWAVSCGRNPSLPPKSCMVGTGMTAQIAQTVFEITQVVARIYDPVREDTYRRMGIHTVCPTTTIASLMLSAIQGHS